MTLPKSMWKNIPTHQNEIVAANTWQEFSPALIAQLKQEGKPFLIDFTAKWCLVCQVNHLVLTSQLVEQELQKAGVVTIKADWTKNDPLITAELEKFGRNSVPLYVMYNGDATQEPVILPQILTPSIILEELKNIPSSEIVLKE